VWSGDADGEALELAFSKKRADDRKAWLAAVEPGTYLDTSGGVVPIVDFVHRELVLFSRADLERSIPSAVDGLKPGQRKILFCAFKRGLTSDVKVAQLAGYVSEHSAYHHGEASLQGAIVGLAQDFVGSNNVNLLVPSGQFGTRLLGGKDAASARYIYTRLAPTTRSLFHPADDALLHYLEEEGQSIEPSWYVPLIPTALVNGADGIGTGWSTFVPNFNPRDLIASIRVLLGGGALEPGGLAPWYRGFTGAVARVAGKAGAPPSYALTGTVTVTGDATLDVTELPVRRWTQDYKEFLEGLVKPADGSRPLLADYREHHTDAAVHFALQATDGGMAALTAAPGLESRLKLTTKVSTSNMVLFDAGGKIKKYESAEAILLDFFALRVEFYARRRAALIRAAEADATRCANKARFIEAVVGGSLAVGGRKAADVEADLVAGGYARLPRDGSKKGMAAAAAAAVTAEAGGEGVDDADPDAAASYAYLLSLPIAALALEQVAALQAAAAAAAADVARLRAATPATMYAADLDALEAALDARDAGAAADAVRLAAQRAKAGKAQAKAAKSASTATAGGKKGKGKKKEAWSESEADSDVSDDESGADSSDVDSPAPRKAAPARKRAPAAAAPSRLAVEAPVEAPAAPAPAAEPAAPAPPAPPADGGSLLDRLAGRLGSLTVDAATLASLSPGGGVAAAPAPAAPAAAPKPRAPRARPPPKKKAAAMSDSEDEGEDSGADSEGSDFSAAAARGAAAAAARAAARAPEPAAAAPSASAMTLSSSLPSAAPSGEEASAGANDGAASAPAPRAPRRAAADAAVAKTARAAAADASDDESEEESDGAPSDEGSESE